MNPLYKKPLINFKIYKAENIYIVTYKDYFELVAKHLPSIPLENILCEPIQKNGRFNSIRSYTIHKKNPNSKIIVCPADHLIENDTEFINTCKTAFSELDKKNNLITLGITPTEPHTGYGYIKINLTDKHITKVLEFKEKPNLENAKKFLNEGTYLWNSGIFIFKSVDIIKEYKTHKPELHNSFNQILNSSFDINRIFSAIEKISFDYAILENSKNIDVIKVNIDWSDLGSYSALYQKSKKDSNGNVINSSMHQLDDCQDNIILLPKNKKIIIKGINNYIIAENNNTILIYPKDKDQDIKNLSN